MADASRLDRLLSGFGLAELEEAVERRRREEELRLKRLQARRHRLEKQLRKVERELNRARAAARAAAGAPRRANARRLNELTLADAMERVLRGRRKPMHYRDLASAVVERGLYRTRSTNLLSTAIVTLKRDGRFEKTAPGLYALRS